MKLWGPQWKRPRWAALVIAPLLVGVAACLNGCPNKQPTQTKPSDGKYANLGNYRIFYRDSGVPSKTPSAPTVICMSGLNDNLTVWNKVYAGLQSDFRVIAYDRGGVGWSDVGPNPRTGMVVEDELHKFLKTINVNPPYILCAHSFAGLFARLYIRDYPDEVTGVVLIDTTHEDQYKLQALVLKPGTALLLQNVDDVTEDLLASTGAIGEWMNKENTFEEVRASRYLPDIPLYFLGEDFVSFDFLPDDDQANAENLEEELYEDMSQLTPRGILEIVPGVGHDIHEKAPQTVVNAVKSCKRAGLQTTASYIFGSIDDTYETIMETVRFSLQLDTDFVLYNIYTAHPGTAGYYEALRQGIIDEYIVDVDRWRGEPVGVPTVCRQLSRQELHALKADAYIRYYTSRDAVAYESIIRTYQESLDQLRRNVL